MRRRFESSVFSFFTSLISSGGWTGAGASACSDAGGGRVESMSRTWRHTMVQGLLVAWWFSGEFDKFANLSHDSNDRCDRVGAEEVSGPVLENTVGPPGRSVQLQVCQWCCKENWRFEFVDGGWWSSNSKKRHIGRVGNLRRPENWYWYVRWDANYCRKQFLKICTSSNTYLLLCAPVPHMSAHLKI